MGTIGFFDSGVGGLTVLEASRRRLDDLSFYYLGDTKHCPYGDRPLPEVRQFALNAVRFLTEQGCEEIVMACNISSSIALEPAREQFPDRTFHGLINDDLVQTVAERTRNGRVGVLATTGTVKSKFYPEQLEPAGVEVIQQACSPLVPMIEPLLDPLRRQNVDTIILGCTHYPFLAPVMRDLLEDHVDLVDPGQVMARRLETNYDSSRTENAQETFAATGETTSIRTTLEEDLGYEDVTVREVSTEGTVQP